VTTYDSTATAATHAMICHARSARITARTSMSLPPFRFHLPLTVRRAGHSVLVVARACDAGVASRPRSGSAVRRMSVSARLKRTPGRRPARAPAGLPGGAC
jgi:hypothetical protein